MKYKNIPNAITIGRIILVPFFILCYYLNIEHWNYYAAAIFIVAALSDMADGMIARKYKVVSNIGKFMDPIADKILAMSALLLLMEWQKLSAWVCIILLGREFIISGFRLIAASEGVVLAAGPVGKWKTTFQMVGIAMILLENPIFSVWNIPMGEILVYISVVLSSWSCIEYIVQNKNLLKG